ncbi:MAG: hypothetical protein PHY47_17550 [Lachnospiraceae bacterium]|nr:hypothetical protein [Lachnospiraceae bacterium]
MQKHEVIIRKQKSNGKYQTIMPNTRIFAEYEDNLLPSKVLLSITANDLAYARQSIETGIHFLTFIGGAYGGRDFLIIGQENLDKTPRRTILNLAPLFTVIGTEHLLTAPGKEPSSAPIATVHLTSTPEPATAAETNNALPWYPIEVDDHYRYFYDRNGKSVDLEACCNGAEHPNEIILNTGIGNLNRTHITLHENGRSYIRFLEGPWKGIAYHITGYHSERKRTILTVTPHSIVGQSH